LRGHFAELGIVAPQGARNVRQLIAILEDERYSPQAVRTALARLATVLIGIEGQITKLDKALLAAHRNNDVSIGLATVPGIGPVDIRKLSYYYRPSPDGSRILFGGRDGTTEGDPSAPTVHLQAELAGLFPERAGVGLAHSWFGYVAMHRDMVPRIFSTGNTVYATGYCGSGVVWARWLGKKAAFKVLGDSEQVRSAFDFDPAPKAISFYSGRPNGGQICVCANRILVQDAVYDEFASKVGKRVASLNVGGGTEPGVDIGPMINQAAISKIERHVADALAKGASVIAKAQVSVEGDQFATPIVLGDATVEMILASEETFGPVAPLFRFKTEEEAIAIANGTPYGLAAYFYTEGLKRSWRVAEALEFGMVGLNTGTISMEVAPFGGVKQSGLGREGAQAGIDEYLEMKSFHIGGLA
jgi:hypothetical protein